MVSLGAHIIVQKLFFDDFNMVQLKNSLVLKELKPSILFVQRGFGGAIRSAGPPTSCFSQRKGVMHLIS